MSTVVAIWGEEEFCVQRAAQEEIESLLYANVVDLDYDSYLNYRQDYDDGPTAFVVRDCVQIPSVRNSDDIVIAVAKSGMKSFGNETVSRTLYFPKLKTYDDNNQVVGWILQEGQRLNIDLTRVAGPLFLACGNRLRKLNSEIRKLRDYCGVGKEVTIADVKAVCTRSSELSPKEVMDSVNKGDVRSAMSYYDMLQEKADETGWIISFFQRQFTQLHQIIALKKSSSHQIPEILGVHPYVYQKNVEPLLKLFSESSIRKSISVFSRLDSLNKTGRYDVKPELENEIIRLSQESENVLRKR